MSLITTIDLILKRWSQMLWITAQKNNYIMIWNQQLCGLVSFTPWYKFWCMDFWLQILIDKLLLLLLKVLKGRRGTSRQKIERYILENFIVKPTSVRKQLNLALKRGVAKGLLLQVRGVAAVDLLRSTRSYVLTEKWDYLGGIDNYGNIFCGKLHIRNEVSIQFHNLLTTVAIEFYGFVLFTCSSNYM